MIVAVNVTDCVESDGLGTDLSARLEAVFTVRATGAEVLAALFASPPYEAVTLCAPEARVAIAKVATPAAKVAVPITLLPSRNCTLPVAVFGVTVAVKVTDCCGFEVAAEDASVTLEACLATVCVTGADVEAALLLSPE